MDRVKLKEFHIRKFILALGYHIPLINGLNFSETLVAIAGFPYNTEYQVGQSKGECCVHINPRFPFSIYYVPGTLFLCFILRSHLCKFCNDLRI